MTHVSHLKKTIFTLISFCLVACSSSSSDSNDSDNTNEGFDLGSFLDNTFVSGLVDTTIPEGEMLSFGGTTTVSVDIVNANNNERVTNRAFIVTFSSDCIDQGKATINKTLNEDGSSRNITQVLSIDGTATSTYQATTCEGSDLLQATIIDGTWASTYINIAQEELGSVAFLQATKRTIALAGYGTTNIPETSDISFIVKNSADQAMVDLDVNFSLSSDLGGVSLSETNARTNSDGVAITTVHSGSIPTDLHVIASVEDDTSNRTTTNSELISMVGLLASQDNFQITSDIYNPRGWRIDGTPALISIRAHDKFHDPVVDGTPIKFITNAGAVTGSCSTIEGECSVEWQSQSPRPSNGLIKILARTTGEESFIDQNANGVFDLNETILTNLPEAFLDINDDGERDYAEFFSDFNQDELFSEKADSSIYQGQACSEEALAEDHCENLIEVRASVTLCMSSDQVIITDNGNQSIDLSEGENRIDITLTDENGLSPANGTLVSVFANNVELISASDIPILNQCVVGGQTISIFVRAKDDTADNDPSTSGEIRIDVTQVDGDVETHIISILD